MSNDESRINELTAALQRTEQKLAERETLMTTAFGQTEAARSQYEQANERAETLRRRLEAKDEQLTELQQKLDEARQTITARDERIATLEQLCAESDRALNAMHQDVKRQSSANPSERFAAMGLVLESLDSVGTHHRIARATTTLGRAVANDIPINSASVSRFHARIVIEADDVYLVDLQSTNGCSINGRRATRQVINDRDVIGVGDAKFRVTFGAAAGIKDGPMDETRVLIDDSAILKPAPNARNVGPEHAAQAKSK